MNKKERFDAVRQRQAPDYMPMGPVPVMCQIKVCSSFLPAWLLAPLAYGKRYESAID